MRNDPQVDCKSGVASYPIVKGLIAPRFQVSPEVSHAIQDENSIIAVANGKYYKLSGISRDVFLSVISQPQTLDELDVGKHQRQQISDVLESLVVRKLIFDVEGIAVFIDDSDPTARSGGSRASYMALQISLLPAHWVQILARPVVCALSPLAIYIGMPLFILAQCVFLFIYGGSAVYALRQLSYEEIAILVVINYLLLLLHELGHAAGGIRAGAMPGNIGLGLYLIYPVMFTDVSQSWLAPTRKRLLVDAGGLYVTGLCAVCDISVYAYWRAPLIGLIAYLLCITTVINLNPFLRMDGYWMISDLLGIHDLMGKTVATTKWLVKSPFCRDTPKPDLELDHLWKKVVYDIYYFGFTAFFAYFVFTVFFFIVPRSIVSAWLHLRSAINAVSTIGVSVTALKDMVLTIVNCLPLLFIIVPLMIAIYRRMAASQAVTESA